MAAPTAETFAPETVTVDVRTPDGATKGTVGLAWRCVRRPGQHSADPPGRRGPARCAPGHALHEDAWRGAGWWPEAVQAAPAAPAGLTRAPQFTGGGVVHGPQPRDYSQRTPKKMKAAPRCVAPSSTGRATLACTS